MSRGDALFATSMDPAVVAHRVAAVEWTRTHPGRLLILMEPMGRLVGGLPECSWCDCPDERHRGGSGNLTVIFTGSNVCDPALECHERSTHAMFLVSDGEIRSHTGSFPMLCPRHLRPAAEYNTREFRHIAGYTPEVRIFGEPDE